MRVAIFADIHGKLLFPFKLVDLYQKETGNKVDYILQCGDIGAFPNLKNLDRATLKYAKNDRDELGFYDHFTQLDTKIKSFLDTLNLNMICVRGNHEDHDFLDDLEQKSKENLFPIDIYERVFVCKSGLPQTLKTENETLTFVGIGRIGDSKNRTEKRFIQPYEKHAIKKLLKSTQIFDLLISHDKESDSERGYGMAEIRTVLDHVVFQYHFYGHTGEDFKQEIDFNGITQSVKVKELEFNRSGIIEKGCMLILTKENGNLHLEIVSQSLTNKLSKFNWKY